MARRYKFIIVIVALVLCFLISLHEYHRELGRAGTSNGALSSAGASNSPCFNFRHAVSHVGETGCVSGMVLDAYTSKSGNTFLDFCASYRNCPFSSVIFASDRKKFGNLETLTGRQVEIRGMIRTYGGRSEIIVRDPSQIQVAAQP
jgi:hypothetical protein